MARFLQRTRTYTSETILKTTQTFSMNILFVEGSLSGQQIIDFVEQEITAYRRGRRYKLHSMNVPASREATPEQGPFLVGQWSSLPWEDFVISTKHDQIIGIDPTAEYTYISVTHSRHFWASIGDKADAEDTTQMIRSMVDFGMRLAKRFLITTEVGASVS
jgi:hypothetical protein